jgi:hypothetical protein
MVARIVDSWLRGGWKGGSGATLFPLFFFVRELSDRILFFYFFLNNEIHGSGEDLVPVPSIPLKKEKNPWKVEIWRKFMTVTRRYVKIKSKLYCPSSSPHKNKWVHKKLT